MGRKLMRVPMDFDYPIGAIWWGYIAPESDYLFKHAKCTATREELTDLLYEKWFKSTEPPEGDGYQLWETTSEGSPQSPVFKTIDELCTYAAANCTIFGHIKISAMEWRQKLARDELISHKIGNKVFI